MRVLLLSAWIGTMAIALIGCSPAVRSAEFVQRPPQDTAHPIRFFQQLSPECAFEELGTVTATRPNRFVSMNDLVEAIRTRARRMGGDAVMNFADTEETRGVIPSNAGPIITSDGVLSGTVIRFTDRNCTR